METKQKRLLASGLAVLLGLAGVFLLVRYVQTAEQRATAGTQRVEIYVADQEIPAGTPATELAALVRLQEVEQTSRIPGAVTDIDQLGSLISDVNILPGEQILENRFKETVTRTIAGSDDETVPDGLFEVTFQASAERAVGGQIAPGDEIAIISTIPEGDVPGFTRVLLRNVLIINVQSNDFIATEPGEEDDSERSRGAPSGDFTITVALTPENAERLIFARENTSLWLVREPSLPPESPDLAISFLNLFGEGTVSAEVAEQLAAVDIDDEAPAEPIVDDSDIPVDN